jgi:hypothetical protein
LQNRERGFGKPSFPRWAPEVFQTSQSFSRGNPAQVKGLLGEYVKPVRSKGRLYLYLVDVTTVGGERQEKVVRALTEEEARQFGWKGERDTRGESGHPQAPSRPAEPEPVELRDRKSTLAPTTEERPPKETTQEDSADDDVEGAYAVMKRGEGSYALEPSKPNLKKGYVIVTDEGRVFCGLCPGFTCTHVEFMLNWLRTHRANSE